MKTEDEVIALAKEHGACLTKVIVFGGKVDGFAFTNTNLQAFAAACTLTHEQAYAIECKAHFEACRIPPEDRLQVFAAACAEPAVQTDLKFNPSWCYGCTPDNCPGCKRPAVPVAQPFTLSQSIIHAGINFTGYNINPNKVEKPPLGPVKNFDADQPAVPEGWQSVPICLTPDMRGVLLRDCGFTVGELYTMLLATAPKPPAVPAAPMTVTDEDIAQAYVDFKTIKNDVSHDMRFVLKAFVTRKGNPK